MLGQSILRTGRFGVFLLMLAGCGSIDREGMVLEKVTLASGATLVSAVSPVQIGSVTSIYSEAEDDKFLFGASEFRYALENSLKNNDLLASGANDTVGLNARVLGIVLPNSGFAMESHVEVHYQVADPGTGNVVFERVIKSKYHANLGDALGGVKRAKKSVELAAKENIRLFILAYIGSQLE